METGRRRREETANNQGDVGKKKTPGRKKKRKKKIRARSDAIIVRPTEGHSYAEVLKSLRENVKPDEAEVAVRLIRKTKTGAILLELEKGGKKEQFFEAIKGTLKEAADVKDIKSNVTIEIRDIEGFSTKEDVHTAVCKMTKLSDGEVTVHLTNPNIRDQKKAFVSLPAHGANKLLDEERIKIGWSNCRLKHLEETKRCFRCFGLGHTQWECKSKDRKGMGLCIRCGEKGHMLKQCKNPPKCCLCLEEDKSPVDHTPGSRGCKASKKSC